MEPKDGFDPKRGANDREKRAIAPTRLNETPGAAGGVANDAATKVQLGPSPVGAAAAPATRIEAPSPPPPPPPPPVQHAPAVQAPGQAAVHTPPAASTPAAAETKTRILTSYDRPAAAPAAPAAPVAAPVAAPAPPAAPLPAHQPGHPPLARTTLIRPAGAESDPVVGWLVVLEGHGKGKYRPIYSGNNTIGRSSTQRIPLDFGDNAISGEEQAYLRYDPSDRQFLLIPNLAKENLVSHNEGRPTGPVELKPHDRIGMGRTKLLFVPLCGPDFDWNDLDGSMKKMMT